jgi:hypothetical protein
MQLVLIRMGLEMDGDLACRSQLSPAFAQDSKYARGCPTTTNVRCSIRFIQEIGCADRAEAAIIAYGFKLAPVIVEFPMASSGRTAAQMQVILLLEGRQRD